MAQSRLFVTELARSLLATWTLVSSHCKIVIGSYGWYAQCHGPLVLFPESHSQSHAAMVCQRQWRHVQVLHHGLPSDAGVLVEWFPSTPDQPLSACGNHAGNMIMNYSKMQKKMVVWNLTRVRGGWATFLKNPSRSGTCSPITKYGGQSLVWGPNHVSVRSCLNTCDALCCFHSHLNTENL